SGDPPMVALVHNLGRRPDDPSPAAALERRYLRGVDGIIAVCEATLADVRAAGGGGSAVVARPGRDHVPALAPAAAGRPPRLLFAGTVMPHKGVLRLLEALAPLGDAAWSLDVVG